MPKTTPTMSATQSLTSALRLKLGWISSMAPPKALAPMKTGSSPKRPVRASGKARAAKAMKCTSLSLPFGAGGGASRGQSIATVKVSVTIMVRGMSRYLRMQPAYRRWARNTSRSCRLEDSRLRRKRCQIRGLGVPIRAKFWAVICRYVHLIFPIKCVITIVIKQS